MRQLGAKVDHTKVLVRDDTGNGPVSRGLEDVRASGRGAAIDLAGGAGSVVEGCRRNLRHELPLALG